MIDARSYRMADLRLDAMNGTYRLGLGDQAWADLNLKQLLLLAVMLNSELQAIGVGLNMEPIALIDYPDGRKEIRVGKVEG